MVILNCSVKLEFGPKPKHLRVWIQHVCTFTHSSAQNGWALGGHCLRSQYFKEDLGTGSKLLMDQPASYMKIIPQLILMGKVGENWCHEPNPSRL
jgi:hypothetical protein